MTRITKTFKVLKAQYNGCSIYGNPSRLLVLQDTNGDILVGKTATNACCGYIEYKENNMYTFTYHYTKSGKLVIDICEY